MRPRASAEPHSSIDGAPPAEEESQRPTRRSRPESPSGALAPMSADHWRTAQARWPFRHGPGKSPPSELQAASGARGGKKRRACGRAASASARRRRRGCALSNSKGRPRPRRWRANLAPGRRRGRQACYRDIRGDVGLHCNPDPSATSPSAAVAARGTPPRDEAPRSAGSCLPSPGSLFISAVG